MASEHDSTEASIRPQTPAARRRNPAASRRRTPAERERLRAESRARRQARPRGGTALAEPPAPPEGATPPGPPEPAEEQIRVRRLPEIALPTPPTKLKRPAPATPAAGRGLAEREVEDREVEEREVEEREPAGREPAGRESETRRDGAGDPEPRAAGAAGRPPAAPTVAPPRLPTDPRERAVLVLALACGVGILLALLSSLGSGGLPGGGSDGMRLEASAPAVAPGGWLEVSGQDAPKGAELVLESRSRGGEWRVFGRGEASGDGDFALQGRVLERPGRVQLRARAPGFAAASPVALTVRPLSLASVGDINLGDVPGEAIEANGPDYPWEGVGKILRSADLAFGNLESAISTRGEPFPKQYNFRGTPDALAGLRRHSGIDVLNLANNHVGDYGPRATVDTVNAVEKLGMKAVGAGPDLRRALQPQIVRRLGLSVGFVGFSEIAPIEFAAEPGRPGTAWATPEHISQAVRNARRKADIVVATFHWGIEKQTLETAQQRALADVAVRAGAQVVIGAHPHTLQPIRRQGPAIVAYSLGNFVFGAHSPETTTTGILELGLTAEGVAEAGWHRARISGGRPMPQGKRPKRIPLRDAVAMEAGVNLF
jgi:poly-gamma-glutamate capsule biosynthesis protein CapA/YwtB (metallophosphatase superfamily)